MLRGSARNGRKNMHPVDVASYYRLFSCKLQATWFLANISISPPPLPVTYEPD